jgi:hypothetical protein
MLGGFAQHASGKRFVALAGKTTESFTVLDLMRLPLGILSGMGNTKGAQYLSPEHGLKSA